jgi:hypothetical protein
MELIIASIGALASVASAVISYYLKSRSTKRLIRVHGKEIEFESDAEIKEAASHLLAELRVRK